MTHLKQIIDTRFGMDQPVAIRFATYSNGQRAILLETLDGEPWATVTCAVSQPIPDGCVAIKDYSENEGLLAVLIDSGILEPNPVAVIPSGYVSPPVHRLTREALAVAETA